MNYELRRYSFGETIGKGFNLYFNNFIPIVLLSLLCQVPSVLIQRLITGSGTFYYKVGAASFYNQFRTEGLNYIAIIILSIITSHILSAFVIHLVSKNFLEDASTSRNNAITSILPLIIPLIGLSLLIGIIVLFCCIGLIIPGIIVGLGLSVAPGVLVIEKRSIMESLKRSWSLTKERKGHIFGILFVSGLITGVITLPFSFILKLLSLDTQVVTYLNYAISALVSPIQSCIFVVVYFNLRIEKEGFNVEHLVQQFSLTEKQEPSIEA